MCGGKTLGWNHINVSLEIVINEVKKVTKVRSWALDMHLVNMISTTCDLKIFGSIWNFLSIIVLG
jgi:hypothetical protein